MTIGIAIAVTIAIAIVVTALEPGVVDDRPSDRLRFAF
jgi:hypothetical protein